MNNEKIIFFPRSIYTQLIQVVYRIIRLVSKKSISHLNFNNFYYATKGKEIYKKNCVDSDRNYHVSVNYYFYNQVFYFTKFYIE